jgi:dolichyl-phosphate-mannose--protein O-mannosyl transferase
MLITLLILVIVVGLLVWLVQMLPIPDPFKQIAVAIVVLLCIFWLISYLPIGGPGPIAPHRAWW